MIVWLHWLAKQPDASIVSVYFTGCVSLIFCILFVLTYTEILVVSCVAVGCSSCCVDGSLSFHRIPKEEKLRELWLNAIRCKHCQTTMFVDDISTLNCYQRLILPMDIFHSCLLQLLYKIIHSALILYQNER